MVARTDLTTDPAIVRDLATARAGTAYFRRILNNVTDSGLSDQSMLEGWSRKHLVAHVGYNARALARLLEWAATGVETPMYDSPAARGEEIELGATLNPEALRHLCEHSAIDLDVRWRDLPADRWAFQVVTAQGRRVPVSETVWMRCREVWLHAIDLDSGGRFEDIPLNVLERLLGDVVRTWDTRDELDGLMVSVDNGSVLGDDRGDRRVSGNLHQLVRWATGRGDDAELSWSGDPMPAPRWI